jgi:hypothetical protein
MHRLLVTLTVVAGTTHAVMGQLSPQSVRTIALSGMVAPGGGGSFGAFTSNHAPVITAAGRVAVTGYIPLNERSGLWYYDTAGAQTLSLFSLAGVPIQGQPGDTWSPGVRPRFLPDGSVVTNSTVAANGIDAIVAGIPNQFQLYARADLQAPGTSFAFRRGGIGPPAVNPSGAVVFNGDTLGGPGVWHRGSGPTTMLAFTGEQAPGFGPGTLFDAPTTRPVLTPSGVIAFGAALDRFSAGVTPDTAELVYQGSAGALVPILRAGNMIGTTRFSRAIRLTQNSAGTIAMWANIGFGTVTDAVIAGTAGNWSIVATRGGAAPGMNPGESFGHSSTATFGLPVINSAGDIAFGGRFRGPNLTTGEGVWHRPAGQSLQLVARSGSPAAGLPAGFTFQYLASELLMNSHSDLVMTTVLAGPGVTPANDRALYAWNPGSGLQLLLRAGSPFPVGAGFRTISTFEYIRDAGGAGLETCLNDRRELALQLSFADGTSGIFVITIPAPGAIAMPLMLVLIARRRRR